MHEFFRTLGFDHEETRFDRDLYVTIHSKDLQNINFRNKVVHARDLFTAYDTGIIGITQWN